MFDDLAKDLSRAFSTLQARVDRLETARTKMMIHYLPLITSSALKVSAAQSALEDAVKEHPELFEKPKSKTLFNWKFGFQKKKGKVEIKDEDKTIKLIKKHLPELASHLITTKEVVSKDAVAKLTVQEAKKISVNVVQDNDVAFAKLVDTEAAKIVKQALKDAQVA